MIIVHTYSHAQPISVNTIAHVDITYGPLTHATTTCTCSNNRRFSKYEFSIFYSSYKDVWQLQELDKLLQGASFGKHTVAGASEPVSASVNSRSSAGGSSSSGSKHTSGAQLLIAAADAALRARDLSLADQIACALIK